MTEAIIQFDKVNKWYGNNFHVLRDVDLTVKQGERLVICGPSGSGKSTLIRCINALEEYQEGKLTVAGSVLGDDVKAIDAVRRQVGMVFQQFNLFPHLTVLENVSLAPRRVRGLSTAEADARSMTLLESLGPGLLGWQLAQLPQREGDIVHHGLVREQVELLEHHADPLAQLVRVVLQDRAAIEQDVALVRFDQAVHDTQQRGLP